MKANYYNRRGIVLVINDNENELRQLTDILSSQWEVLTANDGLQGIELLQKNISSVSVVILSSQMPVYNKYEYLEKIKNDNTLKQIPVLITVDSKNLSCEEEKWIELGAADYIVKPFSKNIVLQRTKTAIGFRETLSALQSLEYDELTGLLTRQAFIHHAKYYIDQAPQRSYCILGFDVENFKLTNTIYGEEKCNDFLSFIAGNLVNQLPSGFAGRFGGDQFVALCVITPGYDQNRIHSIIQEALDNAPIPKQVIKVGIYQPIDTSLPVVRCCDRAFFAIRQIKGVYGKDISYFEDKLQQQLLNDQMILNCMEKALEEKQFKVFYQPKHETVTGKIAGAEALIRWEHPEYGFMSPGQFIPLFEKNGFITKIDRFVMETVCDDMLFWLEQGLPVVPVSINISRRDFFEPGWIDQQLDIINQHKIDHSLIHMEVTESMYSENVDFIISQVAKIQKQGYQIEMDDFGAGYSSLGLLATFPLNVIKLDISFVRNIQVNQIVIENVIKMAHKLGYVTVAEGAETSDEFKILKDLGCDLIQGYVFSKPLPSDKFANYLRIKGSRLESENLTPSVLPDKTLDDSLLSAINEVAEGIPGGFYSYHADKDREVISFNQEVLKIYECDSAEEFRSFVGNSFNGMVYKDDLPSVIADIDTQIDETNNLDYVEYRIPCKTGKIKYVRDYGRFMHTEKFGDIFYVFINDCTEEHNKYLEEQRKNEVIQGISQTFSSIFLLDFDENFLTPYAISDTSISKHYNKLNRTTDYKEGVEQYASLIVREDEAELMRKTASVENIKMEFETSDYFSFTFHLKNPISNVDLVEMGFRKLKDENQKNRVVITFRPISHSMVSTLNEKNESIVKEIEKTKLAEQEYKIELQESVESKRKELASKNLFIEKNSRDFLAELSNLVSNTNSLSKNLGNEEAIKQNIYEYKKIQEKLSYTTNNVIKLIKSEENSIEVHESPTDISHAIEKTKNLISETAREKNITLETWFDVFDIYLYQDVSLTADYVVAIIFNAIKYTPEGGKISFGLRQIPCQMEDYCTIEFRCRDTGIGMSPDFIPHIFERFAREDNQINKEIPSSGLGLTITKKIIDAMHGTIEVKSELGKGSEFIVLLTHKISNKNEVNDTNALISESINNI